MDNQALGSSAACSLMRFGWMVAETRGRYQLGDDPRLLSGPPVDRKGGVLPLASERSPAEQRIESEVVLIAIAAQQGLDLRGAQELGFDRATLPSADAKATDYMKSLAVRLAAARKAGNQPDVEAAALNGMRELFYRWDTKIQDRLASGPYGQASAYLLGRGLAETYWSLDPEADPDRYNSWHHLLVERFNPIASLLRRCADFLPSLAAETATATLEQWRGVATDLNQRKGKSATDPLDDAEKYTRKEATAALGLQVALWRDLLLSGNSPTALVATDQTWRRARSLGPLIRSFAVEASGLLLGLFFVAGAILFATLAGSGTEKAVGGTIAGVIGAFGLTWSAFLARAKQLGQDLLQQLHAKITADAVIAAATYLPASYSRKRTSIRHSASAASARHLGPVVSYT
jgi:hypothetical protein